MEVYKLDQVKSLHERCSKLGIQLEFIGNYPWIYLHKINGKAVTERFMAKHGFCVAFEPIKVSAFYTRKLTDTKKVFDLIRKYNEIRKD